MSILGDENRVIDIGQYLQPRHSSTETGNRRANRSIQMQPVYAPVCHETDAEEPRDTAHLHSRLSPLQYFLLVALR